MPKANSIAEKAAADRVRSILGIKYLKALRLVQAAKTDEISWSEAGDLAVSDATGSPGDDAWQAAE